MLADRVRIGREKEDEYIGEVYLAQDDDFVKVSNRWVYRGSELEIEIPHIIQGEKITSYNSMFDGRSPYSATPVTRVDSNNKRVTDMSYMFRYSSATTLDLSNFNTSKVTNMNSMFYDSSATTLDLSSFDTSKVWDMRNMFQLSNATTLDVSSFDTSRVTYMTFMFRDSSAAKLDLSSFDTSRATYMNNLFLGSSATTGYARTQAEADKFNANYGIPAGLTFIVKAPLAQDNDFVKVSNSWIYRGSELEIEIPHVIQGEKVTSYNYMFHGSGSYLATPVTRVVSMNKRVTTMSNMFRDSSATTLDLRAFDTSNVTTMGSMFQNSSATILDLRAFDTSNATTMNSMFNGSSATILDLSSFDTSNVTNMGAMFRNSSATILDLSSFDTSKVAIVASMFRDSSATTGYARTQADADKLNASSNKPAGLTFVVK